MYKIHYLCIVSVPDFILFVQRKKNTMMKRLLTLIVIIVFVILPVVPAVAQKATKPVKVFWDGGTIPDPIFRKYVLDNFDTDRNGRISKAEAEAVREIDVSPKPKPSPEKYRNKDFESITSLDGIAYFTNLRRLNCSYTKISELSLTYKAGKKKKEKTYWLPLVYLNCRVTPIKNIHCSVDTLIAGGTPDLAPLERIKTYGKKLKYFNVSYSELVDFNSNEIKDEYNLETLICRRNNKLPKLSVENCNKLITLDFGLSSLSSLYINNCGKLERIGCSWNKLSSLHIHNCEKLERIDCSWNKLEKMTISNLPVLKKLYCLKNNLDTLDLSTFPQLKMLDCSFNNLKQLDLSKNPELKELNCSDNPLTSLDVSGLRLDRLTLPTNFSFNTLKYNKSSSFPDEIWLGDMYDSPDSYVGNFNERLRQYEAARIAE